MKTPTRLHDETARLGTELEVVAHFDLTPLLEQFGARVAVLRSSVDAGRHTLWLELDPTETDLDDAVRRYAAMIEALPEDVRRLWDTSLDRCLNTGIQAGRGPNGFALALSSASMSLEAAISTRHQFTVYPANGVRRAPTT
ncbi:MAG TPA: hypothetical protein VK989_18010 [Polyangia bacterium]|jgi:hypothetical protein|nr:hypothetical protein [Polyangia bacterium]